MKNILLIDDDPQMLLMLRETLAREGYAVDTANDGQEATKLYKQKSYDALICDIIMPDKDGIEVILEHRQLHPQIPIVAISGGGRVSAADYLQSASKLGANAVFHKPLDRKALLTKLRELIG